jgi:hypothetical protein
MPALQPVAGNLHSGMLSCKGGHAICTFDNAFNQLLGQKAQHLARWWYNEPLSAA